MSGFRLDLSCCAGSSQLSIGILDFDSEARRKQRVEHKLHDLPASAAAADRRHTNIMGEAKRKPFAIRMRLPAVYEAGQTAAADQNRSLASLMETLLVEHLQANGYLPGSGRPYGKRK